MTAISSVSTTTGGASSTALASLSDTKDKFLTLLTTQLKNQDPMSPMDSTQFTQQLVQFTAVEQQIASNKNLEKLISLQTNSIAAQATSYMGHTVQSKGSNQTLANGSAVFGYTLSNQAQATSFSISDSTGRVVYHGIGETSSGNHSFTWDGKDDNGIQQPDGTYTIAIGAVDRQNQPVTIDTQVSGQVTGVEFDSGEPVLLIGTTKIKMSDVTAILT
jgi:flagellar basal-body rod modification protein FlgD